MTTVASYRMGEVSPVLKTLLFQARDRRRTALEYAQRPFSEALHAPQLGTRRREPKQPPSNR